MFQEMQIHISKKDQKERLLCLLWILNHKMKLSNDILSINQIILWNLKKYTIEYFLNGYNCLCNSTLVYYWMHNLLSMSFASLTWGALLSSRDMTDPKLINRRRACFPQFCAPQPFRFLHLQFNVLQHKLSVFLLFRFNCTYLRFQNKIFLRERLWRL